MKKNLSLYIHIPFCKTICLYCNFLTFANKAKWISDYVEALKKEIALKSPPFNDQTIESVYFGGGTPSLIDSSYIETIIETLKKHFNLKKKIEICIEANPESLSLEKIKHYQKIGINRISMGVQTLNPHTLFRVARPHNDKNVYTALEDLKKAKFKNFGLDLIIGLPNQTLKEFKKQLDILFKYRPTHLSAYFLSYDTPKIDLFIKECPSEDQQIEMYNYFTRKMKKEGYIHYEVSNYALPGYECIHNKRYWDRKEYLGLGLGSHSFIDETVTENTRSFDDYLKDSTKLEDSYKLDSDTQRMDLIMLSLRQHKGIDLVSFAKKYGEKAKTDLIKSASKYLKSKKDLFLTTKSHLQPTEKGFLIIDKITKDLL